MRHAREIVKTTIQYSFTCDECGADAGGRKCWGCEKDVCKAHHQRLSHHPFDPSETCNDPWALCNGCYNSIAPFIDRARRLLEEYERAVGDLEQCWRSTYHGT